eukprot:gene28501-28124_t
MPGMDGADIWLCRQTSGGASPIIEDRYAPSATAPTLDTIGDLTLLASGRSGGITWCEFERPLETCDREHEDTQLSDTTLQMHSILAWRAGDTLVYHGNSQRRVVPWSLAAVIARYGPTTITLTSHPAPVDVSPGSYKCSFHDMAQLAPEVATQRVHIVKYATLQPGTNPAVVAGVLHHAARSEGSGGGAYRYFVFKRHHYNPALKTGVND